MLQNKQSDSNKPAFHYSHVIFGHLTQRMKFINFKQLNRCDWYLCLWIIYYLQGVVYSSGGIISVAILGIILLTSLKYALIVIQQKRKPLFFRGLNLLMIMFTLYGVYYIIVSPLIITYPISGKTINSYDYIKNIYLSLLPIYAFYYFSQKRYLTEERLKIWGFIFIISVMLSFFRSQQEALQELMEKGSSREEITNNSGYLFLSCIPLLVLYRKRPIIQFAGLLFVLAFIVIGMKRGAIAIGLIVSLYFILQEIKQAKGNLRYAIITLSITASSLAICFFIYQMNNSDFMMYRIQDTMEGDSSGRDSIYSFFWTYFVEKASFLHYLIGRGANGTLEIYYNYAHNDWLEIAINQGIFGVLIYILYWFFFYETWKRASNIEAKTIIGILLIIYFLRTIFSMSYADMSYVSTCTLGYALANLNNRKT